jgi:hypothetical protein
MDRFLQAGSDDANERNGFDVGHGVPAYGLQARAASGASGLAPPALWKTSF